MSMMHVRVVVPAGDTDALVEVLCADPTVINLIVVPGAARRPDGDLVLFDVPREHTTVVISALEDRGVHISGSISVVDLALSRSDAAVAAAVAAPGDPTEAVVWQKVAEQVWADSTASASFMVLVAISVLIAAVGIMVDSPILIVGAMVVGPDFGPVAAIAYGLAERSVPMMRRGAVTLMAAFPVAMAAGVAMVLAARATDIVPVGFDVESRALTGFISHPDAFAWIIAVAAGIAGALSLTEARTGPLVGVFISVTTVPAIANMAVGVGFGAWDEAIGSALQLVVNSGCMAVAGAVTIRVRRHLWHRPRERRLGGRSGGGLGSAP